MTMWTGETVLCLGAFLAFGGLVAAAQAPAAEPSPASLNTRVKQCWESLNFSTLTLRDILDFTRGHAATRNADYLEAAKRGFMFEVGRLTQRVVTSRFPKRTEDLDTVAGMAEVFASLKDCGALSWMEQEEAFTCLKLGAARLHNLLPAGKSGDALKAIEEKLRLDFQPRAEYTRRSDGGYLLEDGDVLVFYGDSLTGGYGPVPRAVDIYPKELEKLHRLAYPARKVLFINLGKGGENIEGARARSREIALFRPTRIFLCYGGNNLPGESLGKNYRQLLKAVQEQSPGAQLVLVSIACPDDHLPLSQKGHYSMETMAWKQALVDEAVRALPERPLAIDVFAPMKAAMQQGRAGHSDYTLCEPLDGVHPYEAGALLVAYRVFAAIGGKLP